MEIETQRFQMINKNNNFFLTIFLLIIFSGLLIWIDRLIVYNNLVNVGHSAIGLWFGDFQCLYNTIVLYKNTALTYGTGYSYPPLSVLIFYPLGYFNEWVALILKILLDIVCYIVAVYFITKILKEYNIILTTLQKICMFISIIFFYPTTYSFAAGAINAQILVLTTIAYYYLFIKKNINIASIIVCLASIIKIIPIALILLNKNLRIRTTLLYICSFVFSIFFMGWNNHTEWIKYLTITQKIDLVGEGISTYVTHNPTHSYDINSSISLSIYKLIGFIGQPISIDNLAIILGILKISIIIYFIWYINKNYKFNSSKESDILYFSLLIILPLLLSNTTWIYYWVFMITPIILCLFILNLNPNDKFIILTSLILFTMQSFICYLADIIGFPIKNIVYIIQPTMIAGLLLFAFIINKIIEVRYEN